VTHVSVTRYLDSSPTVILYTVRKSNGYIGTLRCEYVSRAPVAGLLWIYSHAADIQWFSR
jgi:hypothetical protein